jgi:hypothetical protein
LIPDDLKRTRHEQFLIEDLAAVLDVSSDQDALTISLGVLVIRVLPRDGPGDLHDGPGGLAASVAPNRQPLASLAAKATLLLRKGPKHPKRFIAPAVDLEQYPLELIGFRAR